MGPWACMYVSYVLGTVAISCAWVQYTTGLVTQFKSYRPVYLSTTRRHRRLQISLDSNGASGDPFYVSVSREFRQLAATQFGLLAELMGTSSAALYWRTENSNTGELEFRLVAVHPEKKRVFVVEEQNGVSVSTAVSGPLMLPALASAKDLLPNYPFTSFRETEMGKSTELSNGALAAPLEYGSVLLGVLLVWRERSYFPPWRPLLPDGIHSPTNVPAFANNVTEWGRFERNYLCKVADTLCMAAVLEQKQKIVGLTSVRQVRQFLAETLHQSKSPLSALRTFGKLLLRRLPKEESINSEIAMDMLVQSDRLLELLLPVDALIGYMEKKEPTIGSDGSFPLPDAISKDVEQPVKLPSRLALGNNKTTVDIDRTIKSLGSGKFQEVITDAIHTSSAIGDPVSVVVDPNPIGSKRPQASRLTDDSETAATKKRKRGEYVTQKYSAAEEMLMIERLKSAAQGEGEPAPFTEDIKASSKGDFELSSDWRLARVDEFENLANEKELAKRFSSIAVGTRTSDQRQSSTSARLVGFPYESPVCDAETQSSAVNSEENTEWPWTTFSQTPTPSEDETSHWGSMDDNSVGKDVELLEFDVWHGVEDALEHPPSDDRVLFSLSSKSEKADVSDGKATLGVPAELGRRGGERLDSNPKLSKSNRIAGFTKMVEGRANVRQVCWVHDVIEADIHLLQLCAQKEGIDLVVEVENDLPGVRTNVRGLEEAFSNLADNAMNYVKVNLDTQPRVHVRMRSTLAEECSTLNVPAGVCVEIADNGPGISLEDLTRIFEKGFRGANVIKHVFGSGLGLPMAAEMIAVGGGVIVVHTHTPRGWAHVSSLAPDHLCLSDAPPTLLAQMSPAGACVQMFIPRMVDER